MGTGGKRRRFSYANVTATLALFFAMSGGALAAKHYLISSTRQIKPSVLKALKGNAGPPGSNGSPGTPGSTGATGATGTTGPGVEYFTYNNSSPTPSLVDTELTSLDGITLYAGCQGGSTMQTTLGYTGTGEALGSQESGGFSNLATALSSSAPTTNMLGTNASYPTVANDYSSLTVFTSSGQFQISFDGQANYSVSGSPACHIQLSILPLT
jgi:hypothetical protein